MSHHVNVLAPLVQKWKLFDDDTEEYSGIDCGLPLNQMVDLAFHKNTVRRSKRGKREKQE